MTTETATFLLRFHGRLHPIVETGILVADIIPYAGQL
jgi:hypothetical protein